MFQPRIWFVASMIAYAVVIRIVPYVLHNGFGIEIDPARTIYPWNFSPLTALCLFGGAYYADRRLSYIIPLAALALSDVCIGLLMGDLRFAIHPTTPFVYGCFAIAVALSMWLRERRSVWRIATTGLAAETLFFIVTNFGVWAFQSTYTPDATGLLTCYIAALPFFGRSLLSTGIFSAVFFSRLALAERPVQIPNPAAVPASMTSA